MKSDFGLTIIVVVAIAIIDGIVLWFLQGLALDSDSTLLKILVGGSGSRLLLVPADRARFSFGLGIFFIAAPTDMANIGL